MGIKLSEILGSLSQALDMTEGQLRGHSKRTAYIALKIARELSLSDFWESSKFALKFVKKSNFLQKVFHLYKETGLSPKIMDDLTLTRCTNGSKIATYIGFSSEVAKAIECLDEHWE